MIYRYINISIALKDVFIGKQVGELFRIGYSTTHRKDTLLSYHFQSFQDGNRLFFQLPYLAVTHQVVSPTERFRAGCESP